MTHPAASAEPGPGGTCRICTAKLPEGSLRCSHCGAVYGEANRCPHCRTVADTKPSASLRFCCSVCGAPRVPIDDPSVTRSGKEVRVLEQAQRARVHATAARAGAYVTGSFGVLSLLTALLALKFITPGVVGSVGLLVAILVPFLLALYAWRLARRATGELNTLLDRAWTLTASDVMRAKGKDLDAEELGRILRLDDAEAEQLLARLDVNDFLRARVSDDEEAGAGARAERVRVGSEAAAQEELEATEATEAAEEDAQPQDKRAQS
jgi:rubredoxin